MRYHTFQDFVSEALIKIAPPVINKYIDVIEAKTKERSDYKTYSEELKH